MEKYLWKINNLNFEKLKENKTCDILIIGGGITGISLTYYLKNQNKSTILIERNKIGENATMKSTAKLTHLQEDIALKIKSTCGENVAKKYIDAQVNAINEIKRIIETENIDCHLEKNASYLFTTKKKNEKKLKKIFELYNSFGYKPIYEKIPNVTSKLSFKIENTYVFHPMLYLKGLLNTISNYKNVQIYENTSMVNYRKENEKYIITLDNGNTITCKHLVFASLYPPFIFPYFFPFKTYLETSTIKTKPRKNEYFNAINIDKKIKSIRFFKNNQIRVTESKPLSNKTILNNDKNKNIYSWHNYDVMTHNSLALIGKINKNENIYIATGYNTWGMTNSNIAARIISSLINGEENCFTDTFKAKYPFSIVTFFNGIKNNVIQTSHLLASYFKKNKKVEIKWENGKRYGIYTDQNNEKHIVSITCPHMKCALQFNDTTEKWECPCHGSEFDIDGNLTRGPSTKCIKKPQ